MLQGRVALALVVNPLGPPGGNQADTPSCSHQDTLEYKKKQRPLKIRMLDGTVKTVMVDDSKIVSDMLMTICARIGEHTPGAQLLLLLGRSRSRSRSRCGSCRHHQL